MIVHKFGGSSVGSAERVSRVADIVIEQSQRMRRSQPADPERLQSGRATFGGTLVVVSAMKGVTSQLIAGARAAADGNDVVFRQTKVRLLEKHHEVVETLLADSPERLEISGTVEDRLHNLDRLYRSIAVLGELTPRGTDAVASFGEKLSSTILAAVLRHRGSRAQAVRATELLVTDDNFGDASALMASTEARLKERILPIVERGVIPVITGYVGATENGVTTTLGRGGSDYSAAVVGAGLGAEGVWLWSDVSGILTADPNIVSRARTLRELTYAEASDLASFGAEVLHPKTIRPVMDAGIRLRMVSSFHPSDPGTLIVKDPSSDRELLPAIISTTGMSLIAIGSQDDSWTLRMDARALQRLSQAGIDVLMFSQSLSEHNLNLVVREQDQEHCLGVLSREFGRDLSPVRSSPPPPETGPDGAVLYRLSSSCTLGIKEKVSTISVVGVPGWNQKGIVSHALAALGSYGVRVIAVAKAGAQHSVSFCIPESQMARTVQLLHKDLGLEDKAEPPPSP